MTIAELKRAETGVIVPLEDRSPFTFFEGIEFKLRATGATAGDTTVRQRIGELLDDLHGRGGFFSAHAKEYLQCFQPVAGIRFTHTTEVPTLFDQLKPTLEQFNTDEQQEVLEYLVHDTTRSIAEQQQPRPTKSGRTDVTASTREAAAEFLGKLEDVIMERLEPTPEAGKTQFDRFVTVPVRISKAAGLLYLGLKLGACTPVQPTISPESTPAAITQPVPGIPAMTETPAPTATFTAEPTQTETATQTPTETATPETVSTLTSEEFLSKTDEELRAVAPLPDIKALGFPEGIQLTPDVIIRGGEGGNYVLYRSSRMGMVEMAWNAGTGEQMHAAYGPAQRYTLHDGRTVTGLSILFVNSPAMVAHDSGWFGPNPDPRYYDANLNPAELQSPEQRLSEALMRSLGMGHWFAVHTGDPDPRRNDTIPSLAEVPGFEGFVNRPRFMSAEQRNQLSVFWRNTLLADMLDAQAAGENLQLEVPVVGDRYVPLVPGATVVVRLDRLQDHPADFRSWKEFNNIMWGPNNATIRNISGRSIINGLFLVTDQPGYGPSTDQTIGIGMYPALFVRSLFSGKAYSADYYDPEGTQIFSQDYSYGVMVPMCPEWSMPAMYKFGRYSIPALFGDEHYYTGTTTNVCAVTFQTR
jgi:hypothetical protein